LFVGVEGLVESGGEREIERERERGRVKRKGIMEEKGVWWWKMAQCASEMEYVKAPIGLENVREEVLHRQEVVHRLGLWCVERSCALAYSQTAIYISTHRVTYISVYYMVYVYLCAAAPSSAMQAARHPDPPHPI
jgi:hypothetical protein